MGMQNRDGGWAAWSHNHATKKPGPMAASPVGKWMGLPMIMTDPSTEGLTGRVLYTLGRMGHTVSEPAVRRAVDFIKSQRDTNGVWYERWGVNYVQGTAFVLKGLAAVGEDMSADYVRHGVDWLKQHQNGDGGWGEDVDSYKHKEVAGQGPSNPMLTGLALEALVAAGERDSDTARQAAQWLVSHQSGDGSWDDPTPKGVMDVHLKAYYRNDLFATNHALAGLAAYHAR
jgi:squalene-hopene/tetraprenyl-beta-curcumene cyclase